MFRRVGIALASLALALALLTHPGPAGGQAGTVGPRQAGAAIDQRVLADTANGAVGQFLVVLRPRGDAAAAASRALAGQAAGSATEAERRRAQGQAVYATLRQTAAASQPTVTAQLDVLGVRYRTYYIVNVLAVAGDRQAVEAMAARPDVERIASDRPFRAALEGQVTGDRKSQRPWQGRPTWANRPGAQFGTASSVGQLKLEGSAGGAMAEGLPAPAAAEWGIERTQAPELWRRGFQGQGTVYANADTGVQWDHPALKTAYRGWNGATADHNYNWWDAVHAPIPPTAGANPCGRNLDYPCDDYGHGTHTMGTGVGDGGPGNQIGMAPGARWIACRNMDNGWGQPSSYIECLQFFLAPTRLDGSAADPNLRPDVISNSYGCTDYEGCTAPGILQQAVENVRSAGIFLVASAGNNGPVCATVLNEPGKDTAAFTVGATDNTNHSAGFSSRGPVSTGGGSLRKPELAAPGVSVRSSVPGGGYAIMSGTSMAAPHVAGGVALLWSAFPELRRNVDQTAFLLEHSAAPLTTTDGCGGDGPAQVPNNTYGYGLLDLAAATRLVANNVYYYPLLVEEP